MFKTEASGCNNGTAGPAETDVVFSRDLCFAATDTEAEQARLSKPHSPLYNTPSITEEHSALFFYESGNESRISGKHFSVIVIIG